MTQQLVPDGEITATGIESGDYTDIDELSASDADYLYGYNNTAVTYECSLDDGSDPSDHTNHTFYVRVCKVDDGVPDGGGSGISFTAKLFQGATELTDVATQINETLDGSWTTWSSTLTEAQAANITDYTDLRILVEANASGGAEANRRGFAMSWAQLQIPDAGGPPAAASNLALMGVG